ncbi:prolipoprotein diacylglyceryl transferase 1 [Actinomadura sp. NBRC 104412]|uniref:prolipoprotein diacylglyceryl transferase n=1 Tax=Actinomadura sp. NBRC 104412 TaxID=3032203 RepID=UPI0024A351F6|nr:prolipoprotein diacylglyceryl transferase [Actinomadura sp. NBRC 104412]GLZ03687.1 prolipoprotein diacylglyceryl transferase 1 [Actinomadura sp. NBRC 104412]
MQPVASIPSPAQGVWHLGFVPIRAYALMIIIGIVVAVWLGERRWAAKGGQPGVVIDIAVWAVPFGLVGGRVYHVVTDAQRYFGEGRDPVDALKIWEGGLGIWGAVLFGALGAYIGCRRHGISVAALGDAVAPGIALGQAIGRWGNYWNQELYGRPLDTFWALEIDPAHRPRLEDGSLDPRYADIATYHPTFLYEFLWCVGVAALVIWADRRYKLTHGRAFALYLAGYTAGRFWIEWLRIDDAHHVLGMRLNNWTALLVFIGAVAYLYWARGKTGPEQVGAAPETGPETEAGGAVAAPEDATAKPDAAPEEKDTAEAAAADEKDAEPVSGTEPDPEPEPEPVTPEPATSEPATSEPATSEAEAEKDEAPEKPKKPEDPEEPDRPKGSGEPGEPEASSESEDEPADDDEDAKAEPVKDRK